MSDFKRLDGPPHLPSNIQDAEFVDVDEQPKAQPQRPKTLSERWFSNSIASRLVFAFTPLFLVAMCMTGSPPEMQAVSENNADEVENAEANSLDVMADTEPTGPALTTLLENNDPAVCAHPDTVATIRNYLLPNNKNWLGGGDLSDDEFAEAIKQAKVELTEVSPSNIRADIHEISCDANLQYGENETQKFAIAYKIRPSAKEGMPPIYYIRAPELATVFIMGGPEKAVRAQRPSPAEANPAAVAKDPTSAPQQDGEENTVTDDALFAPH